MKEVWKDIKGYEGRYKVSNLGRVESLERYVNHPRCGLKKVPYRMLKPSLTYGYGAVVLARDGVCRNHRIHRLVAETYIFNVNNKPQVNHINGIKTDNSISNLEWVTASENIQHAFDTGLHSNDYQMTPVLMYDLSGTLLDEYKSQYYASTKNDISQASISRACNSVTGVYKGNIWRFKNANKL